MQTGGNLGFKGDLQVVVKRAQKAPIAWKLRTALLPGHLRSNILTRTAKGFSKLTGVLTMSSELHIAHFRLPQDAYPAYDLFRQIERTRDEINHFMRLNARIVNYGVVSRRVITDAGVAFIVDDWDNSATDITNFNYHGCGTGTNAENATDTALQTESTTILNPDSTRATGTKSQPAANQIRSIGTVTFDGSGAITEHGLFSQAATGGGTLWDRSVFSAINVVNLDSIQFTYTATLSSGG